jgi:hypothetical protein
MCINSRSQWTALWRVSMSGDMRCTPRPMAAEGSMGRSGYPFRLPAGVHALCIMGSERRSPVLRHRCMLLLLLPYLRSAARHPLLLSMLSAVQPNLNSGHRHTCPSSMQRLAVHAVPVQAATAAAQQARKVAAAAALPPPPRRRRVLVAAACSNRRVVSDTPCRCHHAVKRCPRWTSCMGLETWGKPVFALFPRCFPNTLQ